MRLVGSGGQQRHDYTFDASGTITTGGTAQLVLPQRQSCSYLLLQNVSSGTLFFGFGSARATATITSGVVTSCAVTNGGFNFSKPPIIRFLGGGGNTPFLGGNLPGYPSPASIASAHCVMTGSAPNMSVSSIVVDNGGAGYLIAPYVQIINSDLDPYGAFLPSATAGVELLANGSSLTFNGTVCTTDPISVYGATTGQAFNALWMD